MEESVKSTTLPLASNEWKEIEIADRFETYVLELKHGWLVFRKQGGGAAGLAFVPRPEK